MFGAIFERAVESQAVGRALHAQRSGGRGCTEQRAEDERWPSSAFAYIFSLLSSAEVNDLIRWSSAL